MYEGQFTAGLTDWHHSQSIHCWWESNPHIKRRYTGFCLLRPGCNRVWIWLNGYLKACRVSWSLVDNCTHTCTVIPMHLGISHTHAATQIQISVCILSCRWEALSEPCWMINSCVASVVLQLTNNKQEHPPIVYIHLTCERLCVNKRRCSLKI